MSKDEEFYRGMLRIRCFEEKVLEDFSTGVFKGTTHTYLGQEANAVGIHYHLSDGDIVFSNHRCHGHFLAYGGDMRSLFAEMMGKATGVCGGRGGSQHLHWRNFYSNGIQGGSVPIATGAALAEKRLGSESIVICFIGDGTLGQGVVYESLNMASLWKAPILYVVENNRIAQSTPVDHALSGNISARFNAFGIPTSGLDSSDVLEIEMAACGMINNLRDGGGPQALILHTYRFGPHSKGDDTRPREEVSELKKSRDPLTIQGERLNPEKKGEIEDEVNAEVELTYNAALNDPATLIEDNEILAMTESGWGRVDSDGSIVNRDCNETILDALNKGLHKAFEESERVVLLGEDILDPYGGAFKVSNGLSTVHAERVIGTPISEAGIVGVATGMALREMRPVVEIMFGDFLTLAADQIINHLGKFRWMYKDQVRVPLVIRTPMGGRRGYGPTHSQSLEKLFLGVPGLKVLAPCDLGDPQGLLLDAIWDNDPVLFVENKILYLEKIKCQESLSEFEVEEMITDLGNPVYKLKIKGGPTSNLTVTAYGYMATLARDSILKLAYEEEVFAELVVFTQLAPFEMNTLVDSVNMTGRLVTIEEGTTTMGWGAEVIARVSEEVGDKLMDSLRVAANDTPIPASTELEEATLPGVDDIVRMILEGKQ